MIEPTRLARYNFRSVRHFGENLKRLRERQGLTQEALALKLKLKRPTPISLMEGPRKTAVPKVSTIKKLAGALDVQPWELLEGVETEIDRLRLTSPVRPSGTSFASDYKKQGDTVHAADAAQARLLRQITGAYVTLAAEVQRIATDLAVITARLKHERDLIGPKDRTAPKAAPHRRRNS